MSGAAGPDGAPVLNLNVMWRAHPHAQDMSSNNNNLIFYFEKYSL